MSYGADFATADPANAPLDPPIFIGAEPFVLAAILLLIAAAMLAGWYLGARSGKGPAEAAKSIWTAIDDAAKSAMQAEDNALKGRAERLSAVIDSRLGKTLKLAKGVSGLLKKLDDAIAGKGPAHPAGAHDHGHAPAPAGAGHGEPAHHGGGGGGGGAATATVTIVTVAPADPAHPPHPQAGGHGPAHPPAEQRDLNQREQTDALRLAVAAFNQHWRNEDLRIGELRAAHAELSNPGPRRPSTTAAHGKVHGTRALASLSGSRTVSSPDKTA